jgi:hypothetical protein
MWSCFASRFGHVLRDTHDGMVPSPTMITSIQIPDTR